MLKQLFTMPQTEIFVFMLNLQLFFNLSTIGHLSTLRDWGRPKIKLVLSSSPLRINLKLNFIIGPFNFETIKMMGNWIFSVLSEYEPFTGFYSISFNLQIIVNIAFKNIFLFFHQKVDKLRQMKKFKYYSSRKWKQHKISLFE